MRYIYQGLTSYCPALSRIGILRLFGGPIFLAISRTKEYLASECAVKIKYCFIRLLICSLKWRSAYTNSTYVHVCGCGSCSHPRFILILEFEFDFVFLFPFVEKPLLYSFAFYQINILQRIETIISTSQVRSTQYLTKLSTSNIIVMISSTPLGEPFKASAVRSKSSVKNAIPADKS